MASDFNMNDGLVLLDASRPFDDNMVAILDNVVQAMFESDNAQKREVAHKILEEFRTNPDTWKHVAIILSKSNNSNSKFFALQVLQNCIQTRWNILPPEERAGIKQYVTELVIKLCMDDGVCTREKHFLTKINESLIQIVKREWPDRWTNFISELCKASRVSQNICENNMRLLNMLSEELFDFGEDHMQSKKVQKLMSQMTAEFREIYDLCLFVLTGAIQNPDALRVSLVKQTLTCLAHFLKWIPYGYIFETNSANIVLIDLLLDHFWEPVIYRIECTKCLTEIGSLNLQGPELNALGHRIASMWPKLVKFVSILPNNSLAYDDPQQVPPAMRIFWETFYTQFSLCLTSFLRNFRESVIERDNNNIESVLFVMGRLVLITDVNHEETFKICVDFWHHLANTLVHDLHEYEKRRAAQHGLVIQEEGQMGVQALTQRVDLNTASSPEVARLSVYRPILKQVQAVFIKKMAKPQEVYILYDTDAREVTREYNPNTAEIALYNRMRTTQIILTNILQEETEDIMMKVLEDEMNIARVGNAGNNRDVWDPTLLNRLCYSVGSITGAMEEHVEKRFLVQVIKTLLNICEIKNSTANKAIVAANIMYVVGQYPRFLKSNWRFLNTVLNKLFEFMRETFPGVQQMACEVFLKITSSCKKVIASATGDTGPYINELVSTRDPITQVLDDKLILWFYEGVANVISATDLSVRDQYISLLMERCNSEWEQLLSHCDANCLNMQTTQIWMEVKDKILFQVPTTRGIIQILRINNRVAKATGFSFTKQLLIIYPTMIQMYNVYTLYIQHTIQQFGVACFKHNNINMMHLARRSMLHLLETFIANAPNSAYKHDHNRPEENEQVLKQLVDSVVSTILINYKTSIPETRDHEVLCLVTTLIEKLSSSAAPVLPVIFEQIFDVTLDMVKTDFHSFPDHREQFYEMLQKTTRHVFEGLLQLPPERLGAFIMSLIWAFKHEHPAVAEKGLLIMLDFLKNLVNYDKKQANNSTILLGFCQQYYYTLLKAILGVLTDTLHKSGFRLQTEILKTMIRFVQSGMVDDQGSNLTKVGVMQHLIDLLGRSFSTLHAKQVDAFVVDLFNYSTEKASDASGTMPNSTHFQTLVRDFLLSLKEFGGSGPEFEAIFEHDRQMAIERARQIEMQQNTAIKEVSID
ncbi:bifunctional Exportin-1 [Babesia duncani]|uniref:Exportin-1 n=1 Tax=Babesia duncani TaxID=323732 RepID=A0AAD9UN48_9APIC|nr:bifunctional Exportin-1 [Babesia duncani]